ncbi:hypothetical protein DVK85_01355 [Flavobacterium arcticum]|uniref:Uncharacterized protein n=1 Tax=Flavobacterium arcticum TaxID=1784713 RepID=A0A345H8N9_9FLAO|nr:hypothetical protein [Flavobacterium arcticum]AXG72949.1 hypothetical protein DVK85_01355 [Flavobacterium arcticum]KAF2510387.1 hypothetical protein E0W72_07850 [Flavobacterium arcticum]
MSVVRYRPNNLPVAHEHGLGLFKKWRKWAKKAVSAVGGFIADQIEARIPFLGKIIADELIRPAVGRILLAIDTSYQQLNAPLSIGDDEDLSAADKAILDAWVETKYKPFIDKLIKDIAAAKNLSGNAAKLIALNEVLNKINAIQDHYEKVKISGVSDDAQEGVQDLLYDTMKFINDTVIAVIKEVGIDAEPVQVTFPMNSYSYSPLFTSSPVAMVTVLNYRIKGTGTSPVFTGGTLDPTKTSVPTTKYPTQTTGDTVKQTLTDDTTTTDVLPTTNDTTENKSNTATVIGIIGLASLGLYAATRKPKKRKASN